MAQDTIYLGIMLYGYMKRTCVFCWSTECSTNVDQILFVDGVLADFL